MIISNENELNLVFFRWIKHLRKRNPYGVHFQLFSDSLKMKILSSNCHFELVKVNEFTWSPYIFTPFSGWDLLFMKMEYLDWTWSRGSLEYYCFIPFRIQETIYEKEDGGFLFSVSFSKSINIKNTPSYSSIRLIKFKRWKTCQHENTKLLLPRDL